MKKYEYDEDIIENITDDFCMGFNVARQIILQTIKEEFEKDDVQIKVDDFEY